MNIQVSGEKTHPNLYYMGNNLRNNSDVGFKDWDYTEFMNYPRISAEWILNIFPRQNVCLTRLEIPCGTIIHYLEKVDGAVQENAQIVFSTIPHGSFLQNTICKVKFNDPSVRITHFKLPEKDPYRVRNEDLHERWECTPETVFRGLAH